MTGPTKHGTPTACFGPKVGARSTSSCDPLSWRSSWPSPQRWLTSRRPPHRQCRTRQNRPRHLRRSQRRLTQPPPRRLPLQRPLRRQRQVMPLQLREGLRHPHRRLPSRRHRRHPLRTLRSPRRRLRPQEGAPHHQCQLRAQTRRTTTRRPRCATMSRRMSTLRRRCRSFAFHSRR